MKQKIAAFTDKFEKELFFSFFIIAFQLATLIVFYYMKSQNDFFISGKTKLHFVLILLAGIAAPFLRRGLPKWLKPLLMLGTILASSFYVFRLNEASVNYIPALGRDKFFWNCLFVFAVYLVIWGITRHFWLAIFIGNVGFDLFYVVDYYLVCFRKTPLYFSDLLYYKTALGVSGNYVFVLEEYMMHTFYIMLLLAWIAVAVSGIRLEKKAVRIALPILPLVLGLGIVISMTRTDLLSKQGYENSPFVPLESSSTNGLLLDACVNTANSIIKAPDGYSVKKAKDIMEKYETGDASTVAKRPNIIVIMNESFTDPAYLENMQTSEECLPFFNSLRENTVRGTLISSVLGGNTPNSEYEMLSGNSMAFFPTGTVTFQQTISDDLPTIASNLKSLGYTTTAIHLYNPEYWNRNRIYPLLGIDSFISNQNCNKEKYEIFREYVTDKSSFDHIIESFETKNYDEPTFIFNVTVQNHGGYWWGLNDITVTSADSIYANEYASLLRITDDEFAKLIAYFENVEEPTIICMFGDHQPFLFEDFYDAIWKDSGYDDAQKRFLQAKVPFLIWANYDIEECEVPLTSINYLSPMLLDAAGLPMSDFNRYLLNLQKKVPVISAIGCVDDTGKYIQNTTDTKYAEDIREYEYLQYYYMHHDGDYDFFEMK